MLITHTSAAFFDSRAKGASSRRNGPELVGAFLAGSCGFWYFCLLHVRVRTQLPPRPAQPTHPGRGLSVFYPREVVGMMAAVAADVASFTLSDGSPSALVAWCRWSFVSQLALVFQFYFCFIRPHLFSIDCMSRRLTGLLLTYRLFYFSEVRVPFCALHWFERRPSLTL